MSATDVQREPTVDVLDELAYVLHGQGCGEVCVCVDDARALLPTVQALIADAEKRAAARAEEALRLIDRNGCENLTRGRCSDDPSRTRDSDYTSTQWCPPCIAAAALDPSGAAEGAGR